MTDKPTTPEQACEIATRAASITGTLKSGAWTDIENVVAALRSLATQLEAATEARDNAVQSAKYTADLCTQALADVKLMTAERDAWKEVAEHQYGLFRIVSFGPETDYPVTGALDAWAAGRHPILRPAIAKEAK